MSNIFFIYKQNYFKFQIKLQNFLNSLLFLFIGYFGEYYISLPGVFTLNNRFIVNSNTIKIFKNILIKVLHIFCFCWSSSFELIGYNFDLQKKLKKNIVKFSIGLSKFKVIAFFNDTLRIFGKKRYFTLFSASINSYFIVINFLLNLRNIFPYKKRGLVPAIIPSIWMKPGKKTKYK